MYNEVNKIEELESDISNLKNRLELSNQYADSLEQKLSLQSNTSNIQFPFILIVFIVLIISLFVLKLSEKKF